MTLFCLKPGKQIVVIDDVVAGDIINNGCGAKPPHNARTEIYRIYHWNRMFIMKPGLRAWVLQCNLNSGLTIQS